MRGALADVGPGDAERVAEQDVVEVHVGRGRDVEHDAEREHAGEDDAHGGVLLHPAVVLHEAGGAGAEHAGGEGADRERGAEPVGDDDAGQHRVADRVAHQRPAAQDQQAGEQRHRDRDDRGDQEGALHEVEGEGQQQVAHRSASRPRRRAASMPCFGAKTSAARKTSVCRTTMMPPVAPSRK